jgi:hypothetical protein
MIAPKPLSRRTVLRGARGVAVGLPLLEAMQPRLARAAATAKRLILVYSPGGTVIESWRPTGTETQFTFGPILEPLEPVKGKITVVDGLDIKVAREGHGHPHTRGMAGVLTGHPTNPGPYETCGGKSGFANGPSIDQVIANRISADRKWKSLYLSVRWPTFMYGGVRISPTNVLSYEAADKPLPPEPDPRAVWDKLFRDVGATNQAELALERARGKSILDTVGKSYDALARRLGAADRKKLEAHVEKIREVEKSLDLVAPTSAMCTPSPASDLQGMFSTSSAVGRCDGCVEAPNDMLIPRTGKVMMDIATAALACDLTRVLTFQWMDLAANNSFPWLGLNDTHHGYQHDRGYQPDGIRKIDRWYAEQFKYLIDALGAVKEGLGSILDSSIVFWFKEISHPNSHSHVNMPFVLAGSGGGAIRPGRWVKYANLPHNNLLVSLLRAYGIDVSTFGKPEYCTGPLANLG